MFNQTTGSFSLTRALSFAITAGHAKLSSSRTRSTTGPTPRTGSGIGLPSEPEGNLSWMIGVSVIRVLSMFLGRV